MKTSAILPIRYKDCDVDGDGNLTFHNVSFGQGFGPYSAGEYVHRLVLCLERGVLSKYDENDQLLEQTSVKLTRA